MNEEVIIVVRSSVELSVSVHPTSCLSKVSFLNISTLIFATFGPYRVRVQFNKDGNSYIHSDEDHDVHFTAFRISKLPEVTTTG